MSIYEKAAALCRVEPITFIEWALLAFIAIAGGGVTVFALAHGVATPV